MLVFPPCFDGSPNGQYSSKATHYSGRPQVHSKYACGLPANKVTIKRTLNLWHSSQYHVCKMYKPDPPEKIFSFWFFPTFSYGPYNT